MQRTEGTKVLDGPEDWKDRAKELKGVKVSESPKENRRSKELVCEITLEM